MRILRSCEGLRPRGGSVVAIGIFDGLHSGHRKIVSLAVKRARRLEAASAVITFYPHPLRILHPRRPTPRTLISLHHRVRLIEAMGVNVIVVVKFTRAIASMEPHEFVEQFLIRTLKAKEVVVGEDFHFGRRKRGDIALLKFFGGIYGFKVTPVRSVRIGGRVVSSSLIRSLITRGDMKSAGALLGRPVSMLGTVVRGSRIGTALGYPTANIDPHHEAIPPSGVYAVGVKYGDRDYGGVLNIGFRPTISRVARRRARQRTTAREPQIEVHIFDFKGDIYGKELEVSFVKKLRPEKRFASRRALIEQIQRDVFRARLLVKRPHLRDVRAR